VTDGPSDTRDDDMAEQGVAEPGESDAPVRFRLRRAPRYRAFGFTGAGLGIILGIVLGFTLRTSGDQYSAQTIAGYFAASFGLIGALLGLGLAVLVERRH
jgi:hypothetical protein